MRNRGNVQKVAADQNVAYNTARNRLDDIVAALEAPDTTAAVGKAEQQHERAPKCCCVCPRARSISTRPCASWRNERCTRGHKGMRHPMAN